MTMPEDAAAIIKTALEHRNHQDRDELGAALDAAGIPAVYYFEAGKRVLRDEGVCLVKTRDLDGTPGGRIVYVLDPDVADGRTDAHEQAKRGRSEAGHLLGVLDYLAHTYGNRGAVRSARRYANNLVAELDDLIDTLV